MSRATTNRSEDQRARLLDGLAQSIREKGLAGTQVSDIVRYARASRRTFYNNFADKESCFVALAQQSAALVLASVQDAVDPAAEPLLQVEQAIDAFLAALTADPRMTLTLLSPAVGERVLRTQRESLERFVEFFGLVLEGDARRDPTLRPTTIEQTFLLVSGLRNTIIRALERGEDPTAAAEQGKQVVRAVIAASRHPGCAERP